MTFLDCITLFTVYNWLNGPGNEQKHRAKEEKKRKKELKKRMIAKYGYTYYLNDRKWNKIKDQKKNESYYAWKRRLRIYGFDTEGVELKTGTRHEARPLIHSKKVF